MREMLIRKQLYTGVKLTHSDIYTHTWEYLCTEQ